jgi:hypothetical protein
MDIVFLKPEETSTELKPTKRTHLNLSTRFMVPVTTLSTPVRRNIHSKQFFVHLGVSCTRSVFLEILKTLYATSGRWKCTKRPPKKHNLFEWGLLSPANVNDVTRMWLQICMREYTSLLPLSPFALPK